MLKCYALLEGTKMYFLKKTHPGKKGLYLQIYESFYVPGKGSRNRCYKSLGYCSELTTPECPDPVKFYEAIVSDMNLKNGVPKISDTPASKNIGYFLVKAIIDYLEVDKIIDIFTARSNFQFKIKDFLRTMIYAQIVDPRSKLKAFEKVIPGLFGRDHYSYDQILDGVNYIGNDYEKFVELFTHQINEKIGMNTDVVFFDGTNYYFEIDREDDLRKKGPSKENRHDPIVSQALLLDKNQIPIGMKMYPGNCSEKPFLRKMIEETKERYDISGKTIQVADKGLNCAKNIYSAVKESKNGYIFSRAIHGRSLSTQEKEWLLLDNEYNEWHSVFDKKGELLYKYKSTIDNFEYEFKSDENESIKFTVKEKRVVTYNPSLGKKRREEIRKEVEKAKTIMSRKAIHKDEYGDSVKYVSFSNKTEARLNEDKINEDLQLAGYNLLVTSEIDMPDKEIYKVYHGLWRIEESFRILKSYLQSRPVFLQKRESINGHFLICYLSLVVLRLLELWVFKDEIPLNRILSYIRNFNITETKECSYINNITTNEIVSEIKDVTLLSKLDCLYLSHRDVKNILNMEF